MLPGQEEGAADFLVQTLAPSHFPLSVASFRPGNLGLFGALLQPHAPESMMLRQSAACSNRQPRSSPAVQAQKKKRGVRMKKDGKLVDGDVRL